VNGKIWHLLSGDFEHLSVDINTGTFELLTQIFDVFSCPTGDIENRVSARYSLSNLGRNQLAFGLIVFLGVDSVVLFCGLGEHYSSLIDLRMIKNIQCTNRNYRFNMNRID
jgi:hypothetical protein